MCSSGGCRSPSYCDLKAPRVGCRVVSIGGRACSGSQRNLSASACADHITSCRCRRRILAYARHGTRSHGHRWSTSGPVGARGSITSISLLLKCVEPRSLLRHRTANRVFRSTRRTAAGLFLTAPLTHRFDLRRRVLAPQNGAKVGSVWRQD